MKIKLLDYANKEYWIDIPDDTEKIKLKIVSGDMILLEPFYYDTCESRIYHFDDGIYTIYKKDFDKLNKITDSYDLVWEQTSI